MWVELEVVVKDKCILVGLYCINCGHKYFVAKKIFGPKFWARIQAEKMLAMLWNDKDLFEPEENGS